MSKLLVLKGLPASGKSTYAKELVAKGWKRVNKDDLRAMIDDSKWSRDNEVTIVNAEIDLASLFFISGYNVVVDDTNFAHTDKWEEFYKKNNLEFEIKFFDVPYNECIERDLKRGDKSVGAKVIMQMYNQYLKPKKPKHNFDLPNCYIFDIDGTLAKMNGRSPYDYTKVSTDTDNIDVSRVFRVLKTNPFSKDLKIFIVSGRTNDCKKDTEEWLLYNEIYCDDLFMRQAGDMRKDSIIKREIYDKYIAGKYNVLGVFDDRNQVVAMWRSLGLTCFQVDDGNF